MEIVYHFVCENSVLLLNGSFVERATAVRYNAEDPLYVTVLPLSAAFLPYTVQLMGGKARSNETLALCCDLGGGHAYVELKPRYAYVYSPSERLSPMAPASTPARLLSLVREGNAEAARTLLSPTLSETLTDAALADFFEGVVAIRENTFTPQKGWLMLKEDGTADFCTITLSNGQIENIQA